MSMRRHIFMITAIIALGIGHTAIAETLNQDVTAEEAAQAPVNLPPDIATFVDSRDQCAHFSTEEATDEARREYLKLNMDKYCKDLDADMAKLAKKYKGSPDMLDVINTSQE